MFLSVLKRRQTPSRSTLPLKNKKPPRPVFLRNTSNLRGSLAVQYTNYIGGFSSAVNGGRGCTARSALDTQMNHDQYGIFLDIEAVRLQRLETHRLAGSQIENLNSVISGKKIFPPLPESAIGLDIRPPPFYR